MKKLYFLIITGLFLLLQTSCHSNEEVRNQENIIGVWSDNATHYFEFLDDQTVRNLQIEFQDGESIGHWITDVYYYDPGYNIVIYLNGIQADVFQVVTLTSTRMTWCWVDQVTAEDASGTESIGKLIGDIIKQAQEGFHLNPELYENFVKISEEDFLNIIDNLDFNYPW